MVGVVRKAKVLIAGPSNPILDAFFDDESTRLVAEITKVPPKALTDAAKYLDPARAGEFDLVIFDRCAPAREDQLPRANTLFIGRRRRPGSWARTTPKPNGASKKSKTQS